MEIPYDKNIKNEIGTLSSEIVLMPLEQTKNGIIIIFPIPLFQFFHQMTGFLKATYLKNILKI